MGNAKKLLAGLLTLVMFLCLFNGTEVKAARKGNPQISIKYINDKTGVKITIGKTADVDAYCIYIKGCGDSYAKYWPDYYKDEWREVDNIWKNGDEKRTYTIKGLPKGTYKIKVAALKEDKWYNVDWSNLHINDEKFYKEVSESKIKTIKIKAANTVTTKDKKYNFSKAKVGETITFGSYEQDGLMTNGKEDIEWIVLSKSQTQMLVLSKYALDILPYNTERKRLTWEECSLRKWLNNSFYKTAFTDAERKLIKKVKLTNADYSVYSNHTEFSADGGNPTIDKVFLLSYEDIFNTKYGFSSSWENDTARISILTPYAITQWEKIYDEGAWIWWLRSPGITTKRALNVDFAGVVDPWGFFINECYSVRPAIYINLTY